MQTIITACTLTNSAVSRPAPAVFHFVGYYVGFGLDQPLRIFTGP